MAGEDAVIDSIEQENVGDIYSPLTGDNVTSDSPIQKNKILGLPSAFDNNTDPDHRAFTESIMYDMPIVNIIPGTPKFLGIEGDDIVTDKELLKDMIGGAFTEGDAGSISNYLSKGGSRGKDHRYYGFTADYTEYFKYVQQMLTILSVNMGLGMMYSFSESLASSFGQNSSIPFYMDRATSISEGANNEFGASQFEGALKSASGIKRELDFVLGKSMNVSELEGAASDKEDDSGISAKVRSIFESLDNLTLKGGVDKVKTVLNGSHMMFPEIWQDSSFSRNYSLSFTFQSPYGTPRSIFNKVYVPFIALLALTLP